MTSAAVESRPAASSLRGEIAKLPAFFRRDLLEAWSYRVTFVSDALGLVLQAVMFYFIGRMVNPATIPSYGGERVSYMEFVTVGIAIGMFISLGLGRVAAAIRSEQLMGTLEAVLMTPTSPATIQVGSVVYDLVYIPVRTSLFLASTAIAFGLSFHGDGMLPAAVVVLVFIPFVWGLGIAAAAALLTFRVGSGGIGFGVTILTLTSGAYFPLHLFPDWIAGAAAFNPLSIAIEGMREPLLAGSAWSGVAHDIAVLAPMSALSLIFGIVAFRLALRRERGLGTVGLY